MTDNPFLELDKTIIAESATSAETADLLYNICDRIGSRFPGTQDYKDAADFMADRFRSYGLENVHLEPFEFLCWRRKGPSSFKITDPFVRDYPSFALPYCSATPAEGLTAEAVHVGSGSKEEFEVAKDAVKGKFALTNSNSGHRTEVYQRAIAYGAVGFIFYNMVPGMHLVTGTVGNGEEGTIPAIAICYETFLEIQRLAERETLVFNISTDCMYDTATTWNVVGEVPGTESSEEWVIMGGHLDSHDIGPCAYDNGAGAITVMETARLVGTLKGKLKRPVRFIGFAAEEIGLLGSFYHAEHHAESLKAARFMINADMPGIGRPQGFVNHKCDLGKEYVELMQKQLQTPVFYCEGFHSHSDHYPFVLLGIPTFGMNSGSEGASTPGPYHTASDTPEKISALALRESACVTAQLIVRAANDDTWPIKRRNKSQIKKLHTDKGIPYPEGE